MRIPLKYGDGEYLLDIPEEAEASIFRPKHVEALDSVGEAINSALDNPLGCERFEDLARRLTPASVTIAVPDETRPAPVKELLPGILERLFSALPDLRPSAVSIIIGGGLHPPMNSEDIEQLVPSDLVSGCRVMAHDATHAMMVDVGVTRRGTPLRVNAEVMEADFKIVVGQIDPHQFVGFTGGAKGIVIGCASRETIEHNHSLMADEGARVGSIRGNPAREDMDEAGHMVGIDLAINVVLDADNKVVELLAGEPTAVLEKGAETCAALYGTMLEEPFDIVVASCGGHPKDISLYQAQKGLNLASRAAKHGGKIMLLAAAPQGTGDDTYFDYVSRFKTPEAVLDDFRKIGFKMGAHKAFLFAWTLVNYDVAVFSEVDAEILAKCHLPAADPDSIIKKWVHGFHGRPRVAVIPNANTTYFYSA
jgi:nickel-dependent lactate racemase